MTPTPNRVLAIIGAAPCVLQDLAAVPRVCACDYMAIGMDAVDKCASPLRYVATFHPADIPEIYRRRAAICGNIDFDLICHEGHDRVSIHIPDWWKPSGSSALLGVQAALRIGYNRIVLCGCPLEGKNAAGSSYVGFQVAWKVNADKLGGKVRSMSGWTKEFLGAPTDEWLLAGVEVPS